MCSVQAQLCSGSTAAELLLPHSPSTVATARQLLQRFALEQAGGDPLLVHGHSMPVPAVRWIYVLLLCICMRKEGAWWRLTKSIFVSVIFAGSLQSP